MRDFDLDGKGSKDPDFTSGQLVRHRHYGYRGVVVEADRTCQAEETWYYGNRSQPGRNQPWYHVLVHGSPSVTYAAEENLEPDDSDEPVEHPLIPHLFNGFSGGRHHRNEEIWAGWEI
jgi:heat shock protein HspQ